MNRPTIVCLCGSTRFFQAFQDANFQETLKGNIVLSVGFFMHDHAKRHGNVGITDEQKKKLDELHLRKIELADEILVINVGDYIGDSTKREVWYAHHIKKRVRMLEPTQYTDKIISSWFGSWDEWIRAAKKAATTAPSNLSGPLHEVSARSRR